MQAAVQSQLVQDHATQAQQRDERGFSVRQQAEYVQRWWTAQRAGYVLSGIVGVEVGQSGHTWSRTNRSCGLGLLAGIVS